MSFEPQNALEYSLMKAASDPAHRPQFYKDLVQSDLFVIHEGPIPQETGPRVVHEGESLVVRNIEWEGVPHIPVFSSLPRLQVAIQEEVGYLALNALELMKITGGSAWFLNPGSDYGKAFTEEEIASLVDGSIWETGEPYVAERATEVMIGQPSNYPTELVEALKRYFKNTKQVKKAYLAHFFNPAQDEKAHTLIAVEVSGEWESVVAGAGMVANETETPDPPVDFMQITGRGGIEDYFTTDCRPFYQRRVFGLF